MQPRPSRAVEALALAATAAYLLAFALRQLDGLGDPQVMEWDARAFTLAAYRFHGSGLFANDLVVDLVAVYATPGWKLVYWIGTLLTDPVLVSRLLPFVCLTVVVWQGYQAGRRSGGPVLGAATVLALVHCSFLWNRMVGGTPRAFAYPLVVAFARYAMAGAERRTLATLLLAALCYPSVFVFCAPAYALLLLRDGDRRRWLRFGRASVIAVLLILRAMFAVDPRIGHPPSRAEAAQVRQLRHDGPQPYYPLNPPGPQLLDAAAVAFRPYGDLWRGPIYEWDTAHRHALSALLLGLALLLGRRRLRSLPPALGALALAALGAFALAWGAAYKLYLPSRMLVYAWPVVALLGLPQLALAACAPLGPRRAPVAAAAAVVGFLLSLCGDGLPRNENLTHFGAHETAVIRFAATLPKEVVVATHPERASYVQIFARRKVLFSASTTMPFYVPHALEMERRIESYYRAYYAGDLAALRAFARRERVDYLIGDERDFGPRALARAAYYEPWGSLGRELILALGPRAPALAHPPSRAIAFRDGTRFVLDLRKL